jgi:hypothetical protein
LVADAAPSTPAYGYSATELATLGMHPLPHVALNVSGTLAAVALGR